jgi:hypothetical protein
MLGEVTSEEAVQALRGNTDRVEDEHGSERAIDEIL